MNDEQMQPLLEAWLDERDEAPREPNEGLARVMGRVPQIRQRGRWWPLPTFERPVSTFPTRELAPSPIPTTYGHTPARGFTMLSALKFMVASVIVALFGGFLMVGVLTTQPSEDRFSAAASPSSTIEATSEPSEPTAAETTSVRSDILPGVELTVEEVEPGVFQVLNDGVRDLALGSNTDIVAGHDDGIYLLRKNQFVRLGSETGQAWPKGARPQVGYPRFDIFEVTPEGTVWVIQTERVPNPREGDAREDFTDVGVLFSFTGDGWDRVQTPGDDIGAIAVAPGGTLWASWGEWTWSEEGRGSRFGRLGPSGWEPLAGDAGGERLHPIGSGVLYAQNCIYGTCQILRYEDGYWSDEGVGMWDVAPDGTIWLLRYGFDPASDPQGLARFAGDTWEEWGPDDLPDMGLGIALERGAPDSAFRVAPDGSLWASLWQHGPDGDDPPEAGLWTGAQRGNSDRYDPQCDGLVRFDGEALDHFLPGRCISMDIATDGSVWVLADTEKGKDLYVITPEAMAVAG